MAFIEIMRIKDLFSVCDNYSCPRASSFNLYLCVCVGMLGSKNSIRSMQAMNAMKVRKRQASGFQNFIGAMRAKNAIKVRKRPASRAAPSAPKSKKGAKAMEAGNGPPNDAGRLLHYGTTIPVGQGPAWIRDMAPTILWNDYPGGSRQKACVHVACGGVHVRLGSEVVRVFIRNVFTGMQLCYSQLTVDLLCAHASFLPWL